MKTIEERAKIYADNLCNCYKCDGIDNFTKKSCKKSLNKGCQEHRWREQAYIQGAKEQKQIDIDKACEWLRSRNMLTVEAFKKAMEELYEM